ncbi:hypothetical protein [Cetobacterium sp.]|uniref:hypothetical protein n=1 Tax=Cetobacterium sp. TaxID=2071632 RepID=UPI003EE4BF42
MRKPTLIDDALSLTMGTTGVLLEIGTTVEKDYRIDALDDARRAIYIERTQDAIKRLKKFAEQFKDQTFSNWVNRYSNFLEVDLEKQLHYEQLSDDLRDILYNNISYRTEQLKNENQKFEMKFFELNINKVG